MNIGINIESVNKIKEYAENLDENIRDLVVRLKNKAYKLLPVLRDIPKDNGKMLANFRQRTIEYGSMSTKMSLRL